MAATRVDFLRKNLKQLMNWKIDLILDDNDQIESLYEDLGLLRNFLKDWEKELCVPEKVSNLVTRIRLVANKAEDTIDLFLVYSFSRDNDVDMAETMGHACDPSQNLGNVKEEIEAIKTELMEICEEQSYNIEAVHDGKTSSGDFPRANTLVWEEEKVVGFDDEAMKIKEQLTGGQKQLEIISIVGMPGLGKTTLARKLYNDPLIMYHFYIRAWIDVSQVYKKQDLLLGLLYTVGHHKIDTSGMSEEGLGDKLRKLLKGNRYLIVMDDIWDTRAWVDLKSSFPNDNNGSRIMFTSRFTEVALHAKPDSLPFSLRFLTEDESWDLFQQKVFERGTCPPELVEIGKRISENCQGLPLAIVVVGGILASIEKRQDQWEQVWETLSSCIVGDLQPCMETLALSYNHLPEHLKPCFLYFALFPEDFEIHVHKLTLLWVAEGFIRKNGEKSLEDVAEEYLMDLIGRNLVLVSRRRSDGGIKACRVHDLLRDFCLQKAEEECFLKKDEYFSFSSEYFGCRRRYFKLFRVLATSSKKFNTYASEIEQLVLLRFLDLHIELRQGVYYFPASISNFWNLETLILHTSISVTLPQTIWKMVNLRHLCVDGGGAYVIERHCPDAHYPLSLGNLQTLCRVDPLSGQDFFAGTPNLRKLAIQGDIVSSGSLTFPDIHFLNHLQKLKLFNTHDFEWRDIKIKRLRNELCGRDDIPSEWPCYIGRIKFPPNLKQLTLDETNLPWDEMSALGKLLPSLEVLKLLKRAFVGSDWQTCGNFPRLKFLKLKHAYLKKWKVSSDHFPSLQRLVLDCCFFLEKIPSEIGDIPTLQMIEVRYCDPSIANSARQIKEEQERMGNDWLQIIESDIPYRSDIENWISEACFWVSVPCLILKEIAILCFQCMTLRD